MRADLSEPDDIDKLFDRVDTEFGALNGLVNNAATLETQRRVDEFDAERLRRIMSVNVIGPILCVRNAIRRMSYVTGSFLDLAGGR